MVVQIEMSDHGPEQARQGGVAARLDDLRRRLGAACIACGRPPDAVRLVAVSKFHPVTAIEAALAAGQLAFGENRVQEAQAKFPALRAAWPGLRLHLIGGLQTNKARAAVAVADVIESLDRPALADAIERAADAAGRLPELLVQVNLGDEAQKSGVATADAPAFIADCQRRFGPRLRGLMGIPPQGEPPLPYFRHLAELARQAGLDALSMGMSEDFDAAIACGATAVRIGQAIFGPRPATPSADTRPDHHPPPGYAPGATETKAPHDD